MQWSVSWALAVMALAGAVSVSAQTEEQQRLMSRRAAEADAYRKLAEVVYGLQLNGYTLVRDFVTETDEIRTAVDHFVRGIRLGEPHWLADGSCEVPAEVTVAKVIESLREIHVKSYHGDDVTAADVDSIRTHTQRDVFRVVGVGSPREDLPLGVPLPADAAPPTTQATATGEPPIPAIWRNLGPQPRQMALLAARKDAQRRLAERIKGLRINSNTTVRDFAVEGDTIVAELNAELVGAYEFSQYLHDDVLIAEVTMRVPTEQVIEAIKKVRVRHYDGHGLTDVDVERAVSSLKLREFEATGMGTPLPRHVQRYAERVSTPIPEWAMSTIDAEGVGADPELSTPQGKLRAARAAEIDARRKLIARIASLQIAESQTVGDLMNQTDFVGVEIESLMAEAVIGATRVGDSGATVTASLPGMRVWEIVQDGLRHAGK